MASKNRNIMISIVKIPMICAGVWSRPLTKHCFSEKIFKLYSVFMRVNFALFITCLWVELIRLTVQSYDREIILSSFGPTVNGAKLAAKVIIYFKNNVLKKCDDVIERERKIWRENDGEVIKLYLQKAKTGRIFTMLLFISTFFAILVLNGLGAYGNLQLIKYNGANNASLESHYMYQFYFPANKLKHLKWTNSIGTIFSYAGLTYNVMCHMLLIMLLMYVATHLTILQYHIKNYIPEDLKEDQMDEMIKTLKGLISEHQYLIEFAEHLNKSCKNVIMLEFILSSFEVSSVLFSIMKVETYKEIIWLMFFFCVLITQIFCLAWSCNEVKEESHAIADATFGSRWHLLNKEGKQLTHMIIVRAQRPLTMTIGSFGPMTTQSFLLVMKAAYSYLSIMS